MDKQTEQIIELMAKIEKKFDETAGIAEKLASECERLKKENDRLKERVGKAYEEGFVAGINFEEKAMRK